MPSIMEQAYADLEAAELAVKEAQAELELCHRVVERLTVYRKTATDIYGERAIAVHATPGTGRLTLIQELEKIAREVKEPILLEDLMRHLDAIGRAPGGKKPKANLASVLSKAPQFEYEKNKGWRLKESAPPASAGEALI